MLAIAGASLPAGCVVLPVPVPQSAGPVAEARGNLPAGNRLELVIGETSRADVLLDFGEPDGRSVTDRWFTYASLDRRGGVHWAVCIAVGGFGGAAGGCGKVGKWLVVRRLAIYFDEAGRVADYSLVDTTCSSTSDEDCPSSAGTDLARSEREAQARQDAEALGPVVDTYLAAFVDRRNADTCRHRAGAGPVQGALELRTRGLAYRDASGQQHLVPLAGEAVVRAPAKSWTLWWVDLLVPDRDCVSIAVLGERSGAANREAASRQFHARLIELQSRLRQPADAGG